MGVLQRGRSRVWIDDRGWWLITVEFQPSDWARGTYLNVGASWLWYFKEYPSFDLGGRVEGCRELTGEDAEHACDEVARRAASEVEALRTRIPDIEAVAREQKVASAGDLWSLYNAAIAEALTGDVGDARRRLETLASPGADDRDVAWVRNLRARASLLLSLLGNASAFSEEIRSTIEQTRRALRLPDWQGQLPVGRSSP
jgi:hypothetical protein